MAQAEGSRVIVTWVHPADPVDLRERGIDEPQATDLLSRLAQFAEDWDRPEMAAYDEVPPRRCCFGFVSGLECNHRKGMNDGQRFDLAVRQIVGKRLTWDRLTGEKVESSTPA